MNTKTTHVLTFILGLAVGFGTFAPVTAQENTRLEARSNVLEFEANGNPTNDTIEKIRREVDYQRAVQAYIHWLPAVKCNGGMVGMANSTSTSTINTGVSKHRSPTPILGPAIARHNFAILILSHAVGVSTADVDTDTVLTDTSRCQRFSSPTRI